MKPHTYRILISPRQPDAVSAGQKIVQTAHTLGLTALEGCHLARLYFIQADGQADEPLTLAEAQKLAADILADPVTETAHVSPLSEPAPASETAFVDVTYLPGVTDPAAENLVQAAQLRGWTQVQRAATGQRFTLHGQLTATEIERLAVEVLSNPVIQQVSLNTPSEPPFFAYQQADSTVETIALRELTPAELLALSQERRLALDTAEMEAIQTWFTNEGRDPTDAELEMLAQTWSEHCVHKTFKAKIHYTGPHPQLSRHSKPHPQTIDGLLKTYLRTATEQINKPWVHSAFVDDAGIVAFTEGFDVAFKVETHNHPSALEPFGGANTGVGGVVRDILGVSARPIANTDVLCFGPPHTEQTDLPQGVLHPRRIAEGVIHGVEDYGNKMGIPTVNGAILYHPGYTANPLVYCGCLGILPRHSHPTGAEPGDLIVVIGGRTGRDGLRGATFSSMEMDVETSDIAGTAVQIGHPINEKQVLEVLLRARDEQLYHAITDCGAGGLSSSVGEMGAKTGVRVKLETVPLKYPGLRPWEIWLSEAQERMVLAVPAEHWPRLQEIAAGQDVEAICIGLFENTGRLVLQYEDQFVGDVAMDFLHDGLPQRELTALWTAPTLDATALPEPPSDFSQTLLKVLALPNIASKEDTIRRYDHEVQGGTAQKPLVGVANHGPSDAAVLIPREAQAEGRRGVALSNGINPAYGELDPYAMAWATIDEALRNLVAVGADPDHVAILDNFCWGNPNLPDRLGALVRCAQGCYDAALAYGTPFISGKDSLNNEYTGADGDKHAIPGTLLISALGQVPDVAKTVSMDLKQAGNLIYQVGLTKGELGGSAYLSLYANAEAGLSSPPPQAVPQALSHLQALHRAMQADLVQACHDCSEGGLAVAVAEMCLAGHLGATLEAAHCPADEGLDTAAILFSESLTRFVVEVRPQDAANFEKMLKGVPLSRIGHVRLSNQLRVLDEAGQAIVTATISQLEQAWRGEAIAVENIAPPTPAEQTPAVPAVHTGAKRVLILHANGTNRDHDVAMACHLAGGEPEIVHVNQLFNGERSLGDYAMLVIPGGFSYGDDLGAGKLWALNLRERLGTDLARFIEAGRPVLGICNGFQTLVKAGLLPGEDWQERVTLTYNASARFECRWVYLKADAGSHSLFTQGLRGLIYCPVAHAEGRIALRNLGESDSLSELQQAGLIALTYVQANGSPAEGYPANPNGSAGNIAALSNAAGNVFGLMPHPENHIFGWQHPRHQRGHGGQLGLQLFINGLQAG